MIDASHIAIITLQAKAQELEEQKQALEKTVQELKEQIRHTTSQLYDLRDVVGQLLSIEEKKPMVTVQEVKRVEPDPEIPIVKPHIDPQSYPLNGSLRDKILYILHQQKRFLHSRELAEYIVEKEPEKDVEQVLELISKQVARYKRNGVIASVSDDTGRYLFYGLPNWMDENKKPLGGYESTYTGMKSRTAGHNKADL